MSLAVQDVLRSRLEEHIAPHGLTLEQVLGQVDDVFGEPLLVVATGSVLAGYGRSTSDIDLYVVVPEEVVSSLPMVSYPHGARVDTALFGAGTLAERHRQVAFPWPPPEPSPAAFARRFRSLDCLSRFGLGLPLATDGGAWQGWQRAIEGDVAGWLSGWYAVEAVRKQRAARLLLPVKPRVAAQKASEAMVAGLERRAVLAGERYFKWKFVGEKLRRLGDEQGVAWAWEAFCLPPALADSADYVRRADEVVSTLLADVDTRGWRLRPMLAPGAGRHEFGGEVLVSRWRLRTVAVDADSPAATADCWDYGLTEPWHPDVAGLFAEDMLWLGVAGPGTGGQR
ncbi:MAG: hypothetical protein ACJ73E_04580 [Mycobacteriales bacterium]